MKKGQILSGVVTDTSFPNKAIIETEEGSVSVKGAIRGQKVSVRVTKARRDKAEGQILEISEKADIEMQQAFCEHAGECGGCAYQTLEYADQLALKELHMRKIFEPVLAHCDRQFDDVYEGIKGSPRQFGYRNKMEFTFGDSFKGGPLALGMHKKGSFYDIVTVDKCQIVDEDYRLIVKSTRDFFENNGIPFMHRLSHEGYLRHLLVRKAVHTEEILIDLVTTTQTDKLEKSEPELLKEFTDCLISLPTKGKIAGILHTKNDSLADAVIDQGTEILYGQGYFYEEILDLKFKITPFSFFQTNSLGAELLYSTAREFIGNSSDGAVLFDLYSGTGTIAQMMASVAKEVIGVEIVEEAVEAAKENTALNGLNNCSFIAGDVLKALDEIAQKPDFIILDPPRDGINPKALGKIINYGVDKLIYISCKPTSLARDLETFLYRGYRVERMTFVDMFPGTYHVETVVLLCRQN